ncbi:hypothetical protein Rs2_19695 [Raphanus sativus]|uniref:FRIGIDA-like protein n=1 Tax=Raphanus sativus TaxID=3726 RepID=A0A6J0NW87_RAPSA|nr:uncharacterized protein LOC108859513 [Raphanus sativus]KAJ4892901.1 hypothetical protein Rs2_19695 [Raphanus sativus]
MDKAEKVCKSIEELRCGAYGMLSCVAYLKGVLKHNMMVEVKNQSRSRELQNLSSDLEQKVGAFEKEKSEAGNLKKLVEECGEELKVKRNELAAREKRWEHLAGLQRLCSEETDKKKDEWALVLEKIKESEKQLAMLDEQLEMKSVELASREKELGVVRESIELSNSELELKKKMVNSLNKEITVCARNIDSKSKEHVGIRKLIEQETVDKEKELDLFKNQIESEEKKLAQLKREMKEVKEDLELTLSKTDESVQQLASLNEQLDLKSKELEEIERELKLKRQMNTVFVKREKEPISDSSQQQNAEEEEAEPIDTFTLQGISASLLRHEISSLLRDTRNPAEFVLERVQDEIRQGSSFQDTFLETLVLIFEELAKVQQLDEVDKSQLLLQLQATEVATLWKEKITIEEAPKSSLEALAFLLFIMAFNLKTLINEEETALLAWSIAQYEQAPILFEYLSINLIIREVVEELIKKSEYISAVKLICLFTLDKEVSVSPSELLKKEIISFRRSALENRSSESSSQAKEKDWGRLRAILELVADYKLEIDIPGDLVAKLMVEGERSVPLVSFFVEHDTSSSSAPQAELQKKQLGVKAVLVEHTGVDEETLGTADVNPNNETSNPKHPPPIIHTYQRRRN